jgi:stage IV sporulation protein FB
MVRFSIFGIPVQVQPFFWIVTAMIGGGLGANSPGTILAVLLFVLAAFVSILVHELGHALTGLRLGGGHAAIMLTPFGGLAMNQGGSFVHRQRFWMVAAGPGAGFAFLILILLVLSLLFNNSDVMSFASSILFDTTPRFQSVELIAFFQAKPFFFLLLRHLIWINFWWGIINLLPIMPLDGGQITEIFVRPERRVYLIGAVAAGAMAALGFFWMGSLYTAILFGYLAWKNYKSMRELHWQ